MFGIVSLRNKSPFILCTPIADQTPIFKSHGNPLRV
jgi:hypothetical protein